MTASTISKPEYFNYSRFELTSMRTRFGTTEWFVADAHIMDDLTGLPEIVFQGSEADARAMIARNSDN